MASPVHKKKKAKSRLRRIGWCERVGLPDVGVRSVRAKIDTGARTSALHAGRIKVVRVGGHKKTVRFDLHLGTRKRMKRVHAEAPFVTRTTVTSSNGVTSRRPVIRTTLRMGGDRWPILVTLVNRDQMGFRLLIGREALQGRCLVDPDRQYTIKKVKTEKPIRRKKRK